MRVTSEGSAADRGDAELTANARGDLEVLVAAVPGQCALARHEVREIEGPLARTRLGPWIPLVGEDGGLGGRDVVSVSDSDDQPDLFL
jgi:hypothetical protein